ncbi:hypothetical protein Prudu_008319, partial [Prunus dulcis]
MLASWYVQLLIP